MLVGPYLKVFQQLPLLFSGVLRFFYMPVALLNYEFLKKKKKKEEKNEKEEERRKGRKKEEKRKKNNTSKAYFLCPRVTGQVWALGTLVFLRSKLVIESQPCSCLCF